MTSKVSLIQELNKFSFRKFGCKSQSRKVVTTTQSLNLCNQCRYYYELC